MGEIGSQRFGLGTFCGFFIFQPHIFIIFGSIAYGGSVSSTAELYKKREADMANLNLHNFNIFHTFDEKVSKIVEHLYDEIKHEHKDYGELLFV